MKRRPPPPGYDEPRSTPSASSGSTHRTAFRSRLAASLQRSKLSFRWHTKHQVYDTDDLLTPIPRGPRTMFPSEGPAAPPLVKVKEVTEDLFEVVEYRYNSFSDSSSQSVVSGVKEDVGEEEGEDGEVEEEGGEEEGGEEEEEEEEEEEGEVEEEETELVSVEEEGTSEGEEESDDDDEEEEEESLAEEGDVVVEVVEGFEGPSDEQLELERLQSLSLRMFEDKDERKKLDDLKYLLPSADLPKEIAKKLEDATIARLRCLTQHPIGKGIGKRFDYGVPDQIVHCQDCKKVYGPPLRPFVVRPEEHSPLRDEVVFTEDCSRQKSFRDFEYLVVHRKGAQASRLKTTVTHVLLSGVVGDKVGRKKKHEKYEVGDPVPADVELQPIEEEKDRVERAKPGDDDAMDDDGKKKKKKKKQKKRKLPIPLLEGAIVFFMKKDPTKRKEGKHGLAEICYYFHRYGVHCLGSLVETFNIALGAHSLIVGKEQSTQQEFQDRAKFIRLWLHKRGTRHCFFLHTDNPQQQGVYEIPEVFPDGEEHYMLFFFVGSTGRGAHPQCLRFYGVERESYLKRSVEAMKRGLMRFDERNLAFPSEKALMTALAGFEDRHDVLMLSLSPAARAAPVRWVLSPSTSQVYLEAYGDEEAIPDKSMDDSLTCLIAYDAALKLADRGPTHFAFLFPHMLFVSRKGSGFRRAMAREYRLKRGGKALAHVAFILPPSINRMWDVWDASGWDFDTYVGTVTPKGETAVVEMMKTVDYDERNVVVVSRFKKKDPDEKGVLRDSHGRKKKEFQIWVGRDDETRQLGVHGDESALQKMVFGTSEFQASSLHKAVARGPMDALFSDENQPGTEGRKVWKEVEDRVEALVPGVLQKEMLGVNSSAHISNVFSTLVYSIRHTFSQRWAAFAFILLYVSLTWWTILALAIYAFIDILLSWILVNCFWRNEAGFPFATVFEFIVHYEYRRERVETKACKVLLYFAILIVGVVLHLAVALGRDDDFSCLPSAAGIAANATMYGIYDAFGLFYADPIVHGKASVSTCAFESADFIDFYKAALVGLFSQFVLMMDAVAYDGPITFPLVQAMRKVRQAGVKLPTIYISSQNFFMRSAEEVLAEVIDLFLRLRVAGIMDVRSLLQKGAMTHIDVSYLRRLTPWDLGFMQSLFNDVSKVENKKYREKNKHRRKATVCCARVLFYVPLVISLMLAFGLACLFFDLALVYFKFFAPDGWRFGFSWTGVTFAIRIGVYVGILLCLGGAVGVCVNLQSHSRDIIRSRGFMMRDRKVYQRIVYPSFLRLDKDLNVADPSEFPAEKGRKKKCCGAHPFALCCPYPVSIAGDDNPPMVPYRKLGWGFRYLFGRCCTRSQVWQRVSCVTTYVLAYFVSLTNLFLIIIFPVTYVVVTPIIWLLTKCLTPHPEPPNERGFHGWVKAKKGVGCCVPQVIGGCKMLRLFFGCIWPNHMNPYEGMMQQVRDKNRFRLKKKGLKGLDEHGILKDPKEPDDKKKEERNARFGFDQLGCLVQTLHKKLRHFRQQTKASIGGRLNVLAGPVLDQKIMNVFRQRRRFEGSALHPHPNVNYTMSYHRLMVDVFRIVARMYAREKILRKKRNPDDSAGEGEEVKVEAPEAKDDDDSDSDDEIEDEKIEDLYQDIMQEYVQFEYALGMWYCEYIIRRPSKVPESLRSLREYTGLGPAVSSRAKKETRREEEEGEEVLEDRD